MICHYCNDPATGKCVNCGLATCAQHGERYCRVCSEAVFAAEKPENADGKAYLQCPPKPRMETIYIDDDGPPECAYCQALARKVCKNCMALFCNEHAGKNDWCTQCTEGARYGTWVAACVVALMLALTVVSYLMNSTSSR